MSSKLTWLWAALRNAFRNPTPKQKESYGRFCHTLAAAALIGGVTVALTEGHLTYSLVLRMAIAFAWALILFTAGALLLEER